MPPSGAFDTVSMKLFKSIYTLPPPLRQTILRPTAASTQASPRLTSIFNSSLHRQASTTSQPRQHTSNEPLIPAPTAASGPLLSRMPNRALPSISPGLRQSTKNWLMTLPIFIILCAAGTLSIFNYQKSSSSTVASILYALRTSPTCRELLGDEIYFNSKVPWISGELNQLHGNIDISFWVKGTKQKGLVRFVSIRKKRDGYFETLEWSLKTDDGAVVQLLEVENRDPMGGQLIGGEEGAEL